MDNEKTNTSNMLQKFKEYVISYMTMLMGINASDDDTGSVNRLENAVRAATSFDEVQLLIHRIYSFTMRRDDKTAKNIVLQDKIYKQLQDLCRDYANREQLPNIAQNMIDNLVKALNGGALGIPVGVVSESTLDTKNQSTGFERARAILTEKSNANNAQPPLEESYESDYDNYTSDTDSDEDMPDLVDSQPPKISMDDAQAEMNSYLQQRAEQARRLEQMINAIPKAAQAPPKIQSPKVQQPVTKQAPRTAEDEYNEIFRRRPQQDNVSRSVPVTGTSQNQSQNQTQSPGMGRFVETASRLDSAHQAELLRMMNAMRNGKQ